MKRVGLNLAIAGLVATAASVPAAAQEEKSPIGPTSKFSNNIEVCVLHPDFEGVCLPQNITQIEGGGSRVRLVNRGPLPLYVALGAATPGQPAERIHASFAHGSLAMDSYSFS